VSIPVRSERQPKAAGDPFAAIVGSSPGVVAARDMARRAARGDSNILLLGETGTGKEVFARAVHEASRRAHAPFVAVNCAAVPETLMESEFFGYDDGAFTGALKKGKPGKFELASGGTIFLDEVGDMPLALQAKVLRAIQGRTIERLGGTREIPVDVRVIAATNKNLKQMVAEKKFREDLYYRLDVITVAIPPLRERREDIPDLVDHFLRRLNGVCHTSVTRIHPSVMDAFLKHAWPGNLRELENVLERALNLTDGSEIQLEHIPAHIWSAAEAGGVFSGDFSNAGLGESLAVHERTLLLAALRATGNNRSRAAKILNISRSGLYKKLKKYGVPVKA